MSRYLVVGLDTDEPLVQVVDDDMIRRVLGDQPCVHRYERDDPETGGPLPPGVDGYRLGRSSAHAADR